MPRGTRRAAALALVGALAAGCSGGANPLATEGDGGLPLEREYWPTDGWRTADPADHGLDAGEVAEVEGMLAEAYTTVRSVLVVRNGLLVHERYGPGLDAEDGHDVRSVTKSVVSALVGAALAGGEIDSLDQTVENLLADHLPPEADPRLAGATLRHLLSMTAVVTGDPEVPRGDGHTFVSTSIVPAAED